MRGDVSFDGSKIDIADVIILLLHLFRNGPVPPCTDAADCDDDGRLALGDVIFLLVFLFQTGIQMPQPFPGPGLDPTEDGLPLCGF